MEPSLVEGRGEVDEGKSVTNHYKLERSCIRTTHLYSSKLELYLKDLENLRVSPCT